MAPTEQDHSLVCEGTLSPRRNTFAAKALNGKTHSLSFQRPSPLIQRHILMRSGTFAAHSRQTSLINNNNDDINPIID
eukprot:scaffold1678_cov71-Cyclotella_meneghiniana.AAC.2